MSESLIGLVAHTGKPAAAALVTSLCREFSKHGIELLLEKNTAVLVGSGSLKTTRELGEICTMLVVLGGDGTILQVVHDLENNIKPIFGINLGSLGFLTCVSSVDYLEAVKSIVAQTFTFSRRTLLAVEVERDGKVIAKRRGLNDAVISRGEVSRLIKLETKVDEVVLSEYNADGLIISTPTGSTAYSLSAGGPILTPDSGVFLITPICPHVLTNRSVAVSDGSKIAVSPRKGEHDVFLTVDGQEIVKIRTGDTIHISKAEQYLPLATLPETAFFEVLRQKLKWSGSAV